MLFDFLVVFLFFIILFAGYKKGFSQMLLSLGAFFLSIFLVFGVFNYIGDAFFRSDYGAKLTNGVAENIESRVLELTENGNTFHFLTDVVDANTDKTSEISQVLAQKTIMALLSIPLLIISFVLVRILIFSIRCALSATTALPVVGGLDSVLGAILGAIIGIAIMFVLCFLTGYLQVLPSMGFIKNQLADSYLIVLFNSLF